METLIAAGKTGPDTMQLQERALAIKEDQLGPDHKELAALLRRLAELATAGGAADRAIPLLQRQLSILESAAQPDFVAVTQSLLKLGELSQALQDHDAARAHFERAVSVATTELPPDELTVVKALNGLGLFLQARGEYKESIAWLERGLATTETIQGANHLDVSWCLTQLASSHYRLANWSEASRLYERALSIREEGGASPEVIASSLSNLALARTGLKQNAEATILYERALAIQEELAPSLSLGHTLMNFGLLLYQIGDYEAALPNLERAASIVEELGGRDHPLLAHALTLYGMTERASGLYADARRSYERALEIRVSRLGEEHPDVARTVFGLADLLFDVGDHEGAFALYDHPAMKAALARPGKGNQAYKLMVAKLLSAKGEAAAAIALLEGELTKLTLASGPDEPFAEHLHSHLVAALEKQGDLEAALVHARRAVELRRASHLPDLFYLGSGLATVARLERKTGDFVGARATVGEAIGSLDRALGPEHPKVAAALQEQSIILAALGETADALRAALHAEDLGRAHMAATLSALAERQALLLAASRPTGLHTALSLASCGLSTAATHAVWDAVIQARAFVLDEMASRSRAVSDAGEIADLARALAEAKQRLANLMVRDLSEFPSEARREPLAQARVETERAERALADGGAEFREELARKQATLDEVARALPRGAALVSFAVYERLATSREDLALTSLAAPPSARAYLAFVLRDRFTDPVVVPLGSAVDIEGLVGAWRKEVTAPSQDDESASRAAGERLRQAVWDPLVSHLVGAERVFLVPDGVLHLVNLAALPTGDSAYLVETEPMIHVLSAERDLVRPAFARPMGKGLLAIGGADYDAAISTPAGPDASRESGESPGESDASTIVALRASRPECGTFTALRFTALPGALRESEEIVRLWGARPRSGPPAASDPAIQLSGPGAGEAAFKAAARGKRVIHLATHGFILTGKCSSALEPTRGALMVTEEGALPEMVTGESPLRLSGLALAGVNRHESAPGSGEDGILTAEEVASLDLSGVEWAVLSACDTGIGDVRVGEGVLGLRRAFEVAGARTMIMSLWSVDDEATRIWMRALYEARFLRGSDTVEAMHMASREILAARRTQSLSTHPFTWGAFVAAGDWH